MRVFWVSVLLASINFNFALFAQDKPSWSYGVNPYYGGVFRYKEDMPQLQMSGLHGLELYAVKMTNGKRQWEKMYNYPHIGIAASYFNYSVPKELGEAFTFTSYLDVTTNNRKRHQWRLNIGTGFVYSTKRYEEQTNPNNKAISSKISYVLRGTIHHEVKLSEQYYFNVNFAFRHFSNGKLNIPNNGMNFPIVGVGLRYVPNPTKISFIKDTLRAIDKKIHFNLMGSASWREVLREDYKQKAYSMSFYLSRQLTRYNTLLIGVDGFLYDKESVRKAAQVYYFLEDNPQKDIDINDDGRQMAVTVGTELLFGKLAVILQGGIYVYKPQVYYESTWYQRYGFKYKIAHHFFPQVTLKSHSRTADMVEFGLGISL